MEAEREKRQIARLECERRRKISTGREEAMRGKENENVT